MTAFKVAVVQAAPVLLDREATVAKAAELTDQAAAGGARLVLFPEAFIPAYPRELTFGSVVGRRTPQGRRAFQRYWDQAVDVPSAATEALGAAARRNEIYLAIGVIERSRPQAGATLYCTLLYFGPDGSLMGRHRKLKPTGAERLIWGEGDGSTLAAFKTDLGTIGGLICWENYMPLARMAMYGKGVDLYLAPTADARDSWQATIRHVACEGRCFVLSCNQFVTRAMWPDDWERLPPGDEILCRGGSAIVSPLGDYLAGPLYDTEGILFADVELDDLTRARYDFDVVGHYNRPDVFRLLVNESSPPGVSVTPATDASVAEVDWSSDSDEPPGSRDRATSSKASVIPQPPT
jgi:nitrilase